jgi:hypothetical protein
VTGPVPHGPLGFEDPPLTLAPQVTYLLGMPKLTRVSSPETGVRSTSTSASSRSGTSSRVATSESPDSSWKPKATSSRATATEAGETSGRVKTSEAGETSSRVKASEAETPGRVKAGDGERTTGTPTRVRTSE